MYKTLLLCILLLSFSLQGLYSQSSDTTFRQNAANTLLTNAEKNRVTMGMYAEIDYNQQFADTVKHDGNLDVHRLVLLFAYKFTNRTTFVTEIELEHVSEIYVEQAFLNVKVNNMLNIKGGVLLIPMGIINEYHEPTIRNGVERPLVDVYIVPTTWREIGLGVSGNFNSASIGYQLYLVNGFLGYDGTGRFRGVDGYRKGRQKGAESVISSPNLSAKFDYYGIPGLKIGLAGYFGKSESTAFEGLDKNDDLGISVADSSVINISMIGLDARYKYRNFSARGEFIYSSNKNTGAYNQFTGRDLGSVLMGYYVEAAYDLWSIFSESDHSLTAFARYEYYNTQQKMVDPSLINQAYDRSDLTLGLGFWISQGAVVKADYQMMMNKVPDSTARNWFNMGIGIWF
jgi:hypothetical protein